MDIKKLTSTLLSEESVKGLSKATGVSNKDVKSILTEALPSLLDGANSQAKGKSTSKSFATALSDHAKSDTSNLTSFLGNIDLADGAKIISHLLGSDQKSITNAVSKSTGVSKSNTSDVLAAIAPLLMSLLGQQADEDKGSDVGSLIGTLLENVDVVELLTGTSNKKTTKKSTKKTTKKKAASSSDSGLGSIIGDVLGKLLK